MRSTGLVALSQSGRSPDLIRYARLARSAGAYVVGLVKQASAVPGVKAHGVCTDA